MAPFIGTSLHSWLTRSSGTSSTRPTSFSAAFAASVPNVPIWATDSSPYFSLHVLDDLLAAVLAEVDVDVGRLGAVRVEEALEQQVVLQRVRRGSGSARS